MPVFGEDKKKYDSISENSPLKGFVEQFKNLTESMLLEGFDYFRDQNTIYRLDSTKQTLKNFFVNESFDQGDPAFKDSITAMDDMVKEREQLFENSIDAIMEHTVGTTIAPVQGVVFPVFKNILMNQVFDKGGIPKAVAKSPTFTRTMERRFLIDKDGNKIDMFEEQDKIYGAMAAVNPRQEIELDLQSTNGVFENLIRDKLNGSNKYDSFSVNTFISQICYEETFKAGETKPDGTQAVGEEKVEMWINTDLKFNPGYGEQKRQLNESVIIKRLDPDTRELKAEKVSLFGNMTEKTIEVSSVPHGVVKKIKINTKLDDSNRRFDTCTTMWDQITRTVDIDTSPAISTTISPEEMKDINALYNVNQLTKIIELTKTVMLVYKNADIKNSLDMHYHTLIDERSKFFGELDWAPTEGYALDPIEWRKKMFWEWMEDQVSAMYQVLNDPNLTVTIFGDPNIIRKITPTEVSYTAPSKIGEVQLDFSKTVYTSNGRQYTLIGSDQMRWDSELIIILCPTKEDRITYILYDYQMYFGNDIRKHDQYQLPAYTAFQRYKLDWMQPIQGRIRINNVAGLRPTDKTKYVPFKEYH